MSVLMRGVEMPKNCEECNFKGECRQYWNKVREAYTRPSWCPLVEVADTPQTDCPKMTEEEFDTMLAKVLVGQTDCEACELDGKADVCKICRVSNYEPQTDCGWK